MSHAPDEPSDISLSRVETLQGTPTPPQLDGGGELEVGARIDHFEIRRFLGEGGMGRVYLARDTVLGRLVALKFIRSERMTAARLARFSVEARLTARFSHPNIVVVHSLGMWMGVPYLALEYLDGETLAIRLTLDPPSPREAMRIAHDVARALEEAHRNGVVHLDLKPANVVIAQDGRPRVLDFGVAAVLAEPDSSEPVEETLLAGANESQAGALLRRRGGTPAYMAPEQWQGGGVTSAADVWALGVTTWEMLAGRHPYAQAGAPVDGLMHAVLAGVTPAGPLGGVPEELSTVLTACLRKNPAERPSAGEVADALARALTVPAEAASDHASPFRGLLPFDARHHGDFHGRDEEVAVFLERLREHPVLVVAGPSGAGKSSFVRAGVVPRLIERGDLILPHVRPGAAPFHALAEQILSLGARTSDLTGQPSPDAEALAKHLSLDDRAINRVLHDLAATRRTRVVLIVDQLEEVFTHGIDLPSRRCFIDGLALAAEDPSGPVRVIVTVRDDFLGRLAEGPAMSRAVSHLTVIGLPGPDALRAIVTRPLARNGYTFDDLAVVDEMIAEVRGEAAGLTLLQFACHRLWERRERSRRLILRSAYAEMGGVAGSLGDYGDQMLAGFAPHLVPIVRALLLRLVGSDDTRRVVPRPELLDGLGDEAADVLNRLTESRLLTSRRVAGADGDAPGIELAHESLSRTWPALGRWIAESRQDRILIAEVEAAAGLWRRRGSRLEETWQGHALRDARAKVAEARVAVPAQVTDFLEAGRKRDESRVRRRRLLVALGAALLGAVTVVSVVVAARFRAQEAAAREQARRIDLARADLGRFVLTLSPFDWDAKKHGPSSVSADQLPDLDFRLLLPDRDDPDRPGRPVDRELLTRTHMEGPGRREIVETRGGAAFVEITGRGRRGQRCMPSLIRLRSLPGYAEREQVPPVEIVVRVPTCDATREGTVLVPAGRFISSGAGDPPTAYADYVQPEVGLDLPPFRIDRTEVTNAAFAAYAEMAAETGDAMPQYPTQGLLASAGQPEMPVSSVDAFGAEDYCRFLGKRLPRTEEWEKAVRGGLRLPDGSSNPWPRRNAPWGRAPVGKTLPANLAGEEDGYAAAAPVGSFPAGASPYGALDLAGNLSEWTASPQDPASPTGLRIIRGGDWDSDPKLELHIAAYENTRPPRSFGFSLGFRCAEDVPEAADQQVAK